jgi:hypothetical protein
VVFAINFDFLPRVAIGLKTPVNSVKDVKEVLKIDILVSFSKKP